MGLVTNIVEKTREIADKFRDAVGLVDEAGDDSHEDVAEILHKRIVENAPEDTGRLKESFEVVHTQEDEYRIVTDVEYAKILEYGGFQHIEVNPIRNDKGQIIGGVMSFEKPDNTRSGVPGELVFTTEVDHFIPPQMFVRRAMEEVEEEIEHELSIEYGNALREAFE